MGLRRKPSGHSGEALMDDQRDFLAPQTLRARQGDEFIDLLQDRAALDGADHANPPTTGELQ